VDRGIIPRSLSLIFHELATRSNSSYSVGSNPLRVTLLELQDCDEPAPPFKIVRCLRQVHISCVEIYNEAAFDLLATARDQVRSLEDLQRVHMLEDADAHVHLRNLSVHRADTEEAALNLVRAAKSPTEQS
jgi:kinesin family member 6/9